MKKTIIALSALVLAATTASATDFDGLYAGGQAGYGWADPEGGDRSRGFSGDLFAGYGATWGKVYLGAEAVAGISGVKQQVQGVEIAKDWGYGAVGRVGYLATPKVMAYGLGGWERGEFTAGSQRASDDAWKFGAGVETSLNSGLRVRTEFTYTGWQGRNGLPGGTEYRTGAGLVIGF